MSEHEQHEQMKEDYAAKETGENGWYYHLIV